LSKTNRLKNKKILITAGPTWVPIDSVRVISNIATGQTGIMLAQKSAALGAKVTLMLGPLGPCCLDKKIRLFRFRFFDDLRRLIRTELAKKTYDFIIHSAAVSDFSPKNFTKGKICSNSSFTLELRPLPKIIQDIRRLAPKARVVMFKLESGLSDEALIKKSVSAMHNAGADFAVANRLDPYRAFILGKEGRTICARSKAELTRKLLGRLNK